MMSVLCAERHGRKIMKITKQDIIYSLYMADVEKGDILLVHSALSSMGDVEGGADTVADAFLEAVGSGGTVVMSTLTGWFSPFDAKTSPSAVGKISEVFRKRPQTKRSLHPVHSVAACGRYAEYITSSHENCETGCGKGTPYDKIRELGGKVVLLGVDNDRNTMMHSLEEEIDARYLRTLDIVPPTYLPGVKKFTLKKFPPGHRDFLSVTPLLRRADALKESVVGNACLKVIDAQELYRLVMPLLDKDPLLFICENPYCNSCDWSRRLYTEEEIDLKRYSSNHCDDKTCEICVI